MKICKNCGIEFDDSVKFCNMCGGKLEEPVPSQPVFQEIEEEGTVILEDAVPEAFGKVQIEESKPEEAMAAEEIQVAETIIEAEAEKEPESTDDAEKTQEPEIAQDVADDSVMDMFTEETWKPEEESEAAEYIPEQKTKQALEEAEQPADEKAPNIEQNAQAAAIAAVSQKMEKKVEKLRQKAAKKAEKLEKKQLSKNDNNNQSAPSKQKTKITFLGVLAAIFLSVFLIVNITLAFGASLGAGVFASDITAAEVIVDGEAYSIDAFLDMLSVLDDSEMTELLESIAYTGSAAEIVIDGNVYSMEFAVETVDMIRDVLEESRSFEGKVVDAIDDVKEVVFYVLLGVAGYAGVVAIVCVIASVVSLGKRRKAILVPSIILLVFGLGLLALSLICTYAPATFGLWALETLFALELVPMFAYAASGVMLLIGIILFVVGITGKKE